MKIGVYIGRFCTFHNGHLSVIEKALNEVDYLIIIIGSAQESDTWENIFDADNRKQLISYCLRHSDKINKKLLYKYSIVFLNDTNSDKIWIQTVKEIINSEAKYLNITDYNIIFYCGEKDIYNYPSWFNCKVQPIKCEFSSTDIRRAYISGLLGDTIAKCWAIERLPSASESDLRIYFQKHPEKIQEWCNL